MSKKLLQYGRISEYLNPA